MPKLVLSGNSAQSYAVKLARVQVVAAYPITPQTSIVEKIADFVSSGKLDAQYIKVESEHSALQASLSAAGLGARVYTATSSQGILLMHELLHWAAGARTPIIMGVANRGVAAPWTIETDHTDTIAQRDTGWIQYYAESNQEVLDTVLQAFRIAEDPSVRLPAMINEDAFFLTHTVEPVDVPEQELVDRFLPPRPDIGVLKIGRRNRLGSFCGPELYMEFRHQVARAMEAAKGVARDTEAEYARLTGRDHGGALPTYRTEDADAVLITMGTASTTARAVVDTMRADGRRVGFAKLRRFRPFPVDELRDLAASVDRIGVVDRSFTFGAMGAAATEVSAALYGSSHRPLVTDFVAGLGGRDLDPASVRSLFEVLLSASPPEVSWPGLKTGEEVTTHG